METDADRVFGRREMDPLGADVGASDPYDLPQEVSYPDLHGEEPLFVKGGDPLDLSSGCGKIDGMPASCSEVRQRMESGTLAVEYMYRDRERPKRPALKPDTPEAAPAGPAREVWVWETRNISSEGVGVFSVDEPFWDDEGLNWASRVFTLNPQNPQDHTFPGRGNPEKEPEPTCGPFVIPNAEALVGLKCIGNGDCVPLVQTPLEILGSEHPGLPHTSHWREGARVKGNTSIQPGTVIATFKDGRYPTNVPRGHRHAAIYVGQNREGIQVIDQFVGLSTIQRRTIEFDDTRAPSNNGNRFSVVLTNCQPRT